MSELGHFGRFCHVSDVSGSSIISEVSLEHGIPAATVDGLKARGHRIEVPAVPLGGTQAIRIDWERGALTGGSDPRKDGAALGF
jgi:gamma-glutamyltranspeptidase